MRNKLFPEYENYLNILILTIICKKYVIEFWKLKVMKKFYLMQNKLIFKVIQLNKKLLLFPNSSLVSISIILYIIIADNLNFFVIVYFYYNFYFESIKASAWTVAHKGSPERNETLMSRGTSATTVKWYRICDVTGSKMEGEVSRLRRRIVIENWSEITRLERMNFWWIGFIYIT